ncbi:MAG: cobalamin biosynthesis protein CobD [Paenibacillaceae bacterium]|jgi:adenosylcobinamide-phosphate synthase|nr:cobalamin biosynthesis protein CobD [Paenibacillaceae bacterium]
MLLYSLEATLWMLLAAITVDLLIGDPPWPTHPVIWIGRLIRLLEGRIRTDPRNTLSPAALKRRGIILTASTVFLSGGFIYGVTAGLGALHPWLGYAVHIWFVSTTIAIKGLRQAAMLVYRPLSEGKLSDAREKVGYIVGRDTQMLDEPEITRAAVETVAENTVDAVVAPLFFALLGGAPLAMAYRAANTLDSMVGYKNEKYIWFGWASARWDDVLNLLPARLTAVLLALAACFSRGMSPLRSLRSVRRFARLHPSPNSGYPEAAVAGALGVELGGRNTYGGAVSERARMGWPLRPLGREDIIGTIRLLYRVGYLLAGGCICGILLLQLYK